MISYEELQNSITSGRDFLLLDVRNRNELKETGKIPKSVCVPCKHPALQLIRSTSKVKVPEKIQGVAQ